MDQYIEPLSPQEIGAFAMIEKLNRLWVPQDLPRENIYMGFDREWHKGVHERMIAQMLASNNYEFLGGKMEQENYLRRTYKYRDDSFFRFYVDRGDGTRFEYDERFNFWKLYSTEPFPSDEEEPGYKFYGYMGCISFDYDYGLFTADAGNTSNSDTRTHFTRKWLSFFRRNCWLSGSGIPCSLEERLEWMQFHPHYASQILEREFESDIFTRRERSELRQALPREFWPQKWLNEEAT